MRYRLRTLLILLAILPPLLAVGWWGYGSGKRSSTGEHTGLIFVQTLNGFRRMRAIRQEQHTIGHDREPPMFRFTIRDVLWLTVVVAFRIALGFPSAEQREVGQMKVTIEQQKKSHAAEVARLKKSMHPRCLSRPRVTGMNCRKSGRSRRSEPRASRFCQAPNLTMFRYKLRTLLILLAVLPPLLWIGWTKYEAWRAEQERQRALRALREQARQLGPGILYIGGMKSQPVTVPEEPR